VPGSARKPGPDMNMIWPSIIEENQSKKLKKGAQPGGHTPYIKIQKLVEELEAISHPNEEQECLREIL
jgi:hypothetical protein